MVAARRFQGPAILVFQEIFGVSPYIERRAADLAALGYVVLAPEFFWRLGVAAVADGPDMLEQGVALSQRFDGRRASRTESPRSSGWLPRQEVTGPVGLVGFCFGGGLAFNVAARDRTRAAGQLLRVRPSRSARARFRLRSRPRSIHHFGQADSYLDAATVPSGSGRPVAPTGRLEFYTYPE